MTISKGIFLTNCKSNLLLSSVYNEVSSSKTINLRTLPIYRFLAGNPRFIVFLAGYLIVYTTYVNDIFILILILILIIIIIIIIIIIFLKTFLKQSNHHKIIIK